MFSQGRIVFFKHKQCKKYRSLATAKEMRTSKKAVQVKLQRSSKRGNVKEIQEVTNIILNLQKCRIELKT